LGRGTGYYRELLTCTHHAGCVPCIYQFFLFSLMRYYHTVAHGKGGRDDGFVPAEEYDELSKLCDKLLTQQEQLQEEVRKQKQMLQVRVLWLQSCVTS
jgi:hypothetical protein